jgi:hypothetical protein
VPVPTVAGSVPLPASPERALLAAVASAVQVTAEAEGERARAKEALQAAEDKHMRALAEQATAEAALLVYARGK